MKFAQWQKDITQNLEQFLASSLPSDFMADVIKYSVFPTGKLFRPLLVYSLAHDLKSFHQNHEHFAVSLELHHTYTLIHDDLPAMDNDDMRRGRAASHKKFNEWKAILAGDALLNLSYQALSNIDHKDLKIILSKYSELMGPKGLIQGQALDLSENNETLDELLLIHELKTARLIQLALIGSNILSGSKLENKICRELGFSLGISFQLLDDLGELCEEISEHEKKINPFTNSYAEKALSQLEFHLERINIILSQNNLSSLHQFIKMYLEKIFEKLLEHESNLHQYIQIDINYFKNVGK